MGNIFFTSDSHWGHKNLIRGISEWSEKDATRDFNTMEEHNQAIVEGINKYVKEDDILYHLGDFHLGNIENLWNFREQLNVKTIHLIYGNHSHHIQSDRELPNGEISSWDGYEYIKVKPRAKELFTSVQHYLEVKIKNKQFIMCHYPLLSWNHSSRGSIMLHGHEHSGIDHLNVNIKRLDVGADVAYKMFGEYRPFNVDEIIQIMDNRDSLILGHHTGQY